MNRFLGLVIGVAVIATGTSAALAQGPQPQTAPGNQPRPAIQTQPVANPSLSNFVEIKPGMWAWGRPTKPIFSGLLPIYPEAYDYIPGQGGGQR